MDRLWNTHFRRLTFVTLLFLSVFWSSVLTADEAATLPFDQIQKKSVSVTSDISSLQSPKTQVTPPYSILHSQTPESHPVRALSQDNETGDLDKTESVKNGTLAEAERTKTTRAIPRSNRDERRERNRIQNENSHSYYQNRYYTTEYSYRNVDRFFHEGSTGYEYSTNYDGPKLEGETSVVNDIDPSTLAFSTRTVTGQEPTRADGESTQHSTRQFSSNYATMDVIASKNSVIVEVPLSTLSVVKLVDNKLEDANDEQDQYHTGDKDLRHVIKPTPSQSSDLEGSSSASLNPEMLSRSYLTEELTPTMLAPGKHPDSKLVTQTLQVVPEPLGELNTAKTPELKITADVQANIVSGDSSAAFVTNVTATVASSSRAVVETESNEQNELPSPVSISLIGFPDKRNNTAPSVLTTYLPVTELLPSTSTPDSPNGLGGNFCLPDSSTSCRRQMITLMLSFTWEEFCSGAKAYAWLLALMISTGDNEHNGTQGAWDSIVLVDPRRCPTSYRGPEPTRLNTDDIRVAIYVKDSENRVDKRLTKQLGKNLMKDKCRYYDICHKITQVSTLSDESSDEASSVPLSASGGGMVVGVSLSVLAAVFLLSMTAFLVILRQRSKSKSSSISQPEQRSRASFDAYSMDSFSTGHRKRRSRLSLRSFLNQAFEDPDVPTRPLSFNNLTNVLSNKNLLEEEFKKLPTSMPMLDTVPAGAEIKNRYANVIPVPETRVRLTTATANDPIGDYINANCVRGYGGKSCAYIASQAPLPDTLEDFWRMVWEQQSRMILMITQLQENGAVRCEAYFPENTLDCHRTYGDFQVSLQNKDVRENFTVSTLRLYEMEKNLFRDVVHLWYRTWPPHGVPPDPSTLLSFMMETRNHSQRNAGPLVVHCSPGTGRTGTVMALDWCMREYDESRVVDVQRCVCRLRQDRAGSVQTHLQYILIHEVLHEYILKMGSQSQRPSLKSLMSFKLTH